MRFSLATPRSVSQDVPLNENPPRIAANTVAEVRKALDLYRKEVEATGMTDSSKKTYLLHAEHFVRWLEGDFVPGTRLIR